MLSLSILMGLMGYQAQAQTCDTISAFPWKANFSSNFSCWQQSGNGHWTSVNGQDVWGVLNGSGSTTGYITLTTPYIRLNCDSTGLRLWWKDQRNVMYPNLRVMVLKEDNTRDTIYTADMGTALTLHSVNLAAYIGQTIRIAFEARLCCGGESYRATLSQIGIYSQYTPMGSLSAPKLTTVGSSTAAILTLTQGQTPISRTWHSTMLGDFVDIDTLPLLYTEAGWDTLTVTASNAYGSMTQTTMVRVHECGTATTLPWREDFDGYDTASYNVCWTINGWQHQTKGSSTRYYDENGGYNSYTQLMTGGNNNSKYMLSPAISIPAEGMEHLRLWVQSYRVPMVRISPTASLTPADYTDTLHPGANISNMAWQIFDLSAYAGQTIRVGIFGTSNSPAVNCVRVDYDTLPVAYVTGSNETITDSSTLFTAHLRHGAEENLHYLWSSQLGGTIITNTMGDSMWVSYAGGGNDTLTAVAINAYGTNTIRWALHVIDCTPATTLPWKETFNDGIYCWYVPQGSNWSFTGNSGNYNRVIASSCTPEGTYRWVMSKAVTLPADTALLPTLFWKAAARVGQADYRYSVLVSTGNDRTDTTAYTLLYHDTTALPQAGTYNTNLADRSASLTAYAGQTIYVAFRNETAHSGSTRQLAIDDVEVRCAAIPAISMTANSSDYYDGDTATFTVSLLEGRTSGLIYIWHSTLLDSTWTTGYSGDSDSCNIIYSAAGKDTVSVIATNAYGVDAAYVIVHAHYCPMALPVPFAEPFESESLLTCWRTWYFYTGENSRGGWGIDHDPWRNPYERIIVMHVKDDDSWLISPKIAIPANADGLNLNMLTCGYPNDPGNAFLSILVSTTGAEGKENFTDTILYNRWFPFTWENLRVPLGAYAGQQIQLAFVHSVNGLYQQGLMIDSLRIDYDSVPLAGIQHTAAYVGDTNVFTATTGNCISTGLTFSWHSTLLDSTWTSGGAENCNIVYYVDGIDTVTVTVTNIYGTSSAVAIVEVLSHPLPQVTLSHPSNANISDTITYTALINDCSHNGLVFRWHSSLLDTTLVGPLPTIDLIYTVAGIDTIMVVVNNRYGVDTAVATVSVIDCSPKTVPYVETFESVADTAWNVQGYLADCWTSIWGGSDNVAPHVIANGGYTWISNIPDKALLMVAGSSNGCVGNAYVMLPGFVDSLQNLTLALDYRYENASMGTLSVGYFNNSGDFVPVKNLVGHNGSYLRDTVRFDTVSVWNAHMALRWNYTSSYYAVVVDNIEVFTDVTAGMLPRITLDAPSTVDIYDTVVYTAQLTNGDTTGLTYTWHSTYFDSTIVTTLPYFTAVYTVRGVEHLTVTATNAYGSSTANATITVSDCHRRRVPYIEDFEDVAATGYTTIGSLPMCWERTWSGASAIAPHVVTSSNPEPFIITDHALCMMAGTANAWAGQSEVRLPEFLDTLNQLAIAFDHRWDNAYDGILSLGYYDISGVYTHLLYLPRRYGAYHRDTVDLSALPVTATRLALRWASGSWQNYVAIDNIEIYNTHQIGGSSQMAIYGPSQATVYDTVTYLAEIIRGDATGATFVWHSSLTGQTTTGATMQISYTTAGTDTLTVVATTAQGPDTATGIVAVVWPDYLLPSVSLNVDETYYLCDPAIFTTQFQGDTTGLYYTWHSSLMNSTWTTGGSGNCTIMYLASGIDTVSVVATNIYGSDMASQIVLIRDCPVITGFPYVSVPAASDDSLYCWKIWQFDPEPATTSTTHGRWCRFPDFYHDQRPAMMSNEWNPNTSATPVVTLDDWLVSPSMALPGVIDSLVPRITLRFNSYCEYTSYQLLLSTTDRNSPDNYTDTIYTETKGYNLTGPWESHTIDLTAYAGQTVSVAFHHSGPIAPYEHGKVYMDSMIVNCTYDTMRYTLTLQSADTVMGTVAGSGTYGAGTTVTATATPKSGYHFVMWSDSVTDAVRRVRMESDITLTAYFAASEGIGEVADTDFRLYPNPAHEVVTIELNEELRMKNEELLEVLDMQGRTVLTQKIKQSGTLDVSGLPRGVYFVRLDGSGTVRKLIVR